jgi:hypothetical protein
MKSLSEEVLAGKPKRRLQPVIRRKRRQSKAALIEKAINSIEEKLESNEVKATIGDFIRLLQLQKELQDDQPREVRITWVDHEDPEPATEI